MLEILVFWHSWTEGMFVFWLSALFVTISLYYKVYFHVTKLNLNNIVGQNWTACNIAYLQYFQEIFPDYDFLNS